MRICPKCKNTFTEDLNYCLEDGTPLVQTSTNDSFGERETLEHNPHGKAATKLTETPTIPFQIQSRETQASAKKSNVLKILAAVGLALLLLVPLIGFGIYQIASNLFSNTNSSTIVKPRIPDKTPDRSKLEAKIDVEIVGKVKDNFGNAYFKCIVTNAGKTVVSKPTVNLTFYDGDIKVHDLYGYSKLEYLKPGQKVPVWMTHPFKLKYTRVEIDPKPQRVARKRESELYPSVEITEAKMYTKVVNSSHNYRVFRDTRYHASGIVENQSDEEISPELFILYYNEKKEIVGIYLKPIASLKPGEKAKFDTPIGMNDTFGKPKTFEVIAIDD